MSSQASKRARLEFLQEPRGKRLPLRLLAPDAKVGLVEWFRPGEHERVERALEDLKRLGVSRLRTAISWAEWPTSAGQEWYRWLLPRLAKQVEVLPCLVHTPPALGVAPKTSSPPRVPQDYTRFVDQVLAAVGKHFEYVELWDEPNDINEWDWTLDRQWSVFCEMIGAAAYQARRRGQRTVLGGLSPVDPNWLELLFQRGIMQHIDVVGFHGLPDTFEHAWESWDRGLRKIQQELERHRSPLEVWITRAGVSTWRHNEYQQLQALVEALSVPVPRVYWWSLHDLDPDLPAAGGFHTDERDYHFGLKRSSGPGKLLFRLWAEGGLEAVQHAARAARAPRRNRRARPVAITGGAGFIGANLADRLASEGQPVLLVDNLSRPGAEANLQWLQETHGDRVHIAVADVRDRFALKGLDQAACVFHFAAHSSAAADAADPVEEAEVDLRGTLNVLEALRALPEPPPLVFTSTSRVYGTLSDLPCTDDGPRACPEEEPFRTWGVSETQALDFRGPGACSKGAADQYVLEYARSYHLPAVVLRLSAVYGPHEADDEGCGWIAHVLRCARRGEPVTLVGDGRQVQDVLYITDLVDALLLAQANAVSLPGRAFNLGGGPANTVSPRELLSLVGQLSGREPKVRFADPRPADPRYYASDIRGFRQATGWSPKVSVREGVTAFFEWLNARTQTIPATPHASLKVAS